MNQIRGGIDPGRARPAGSALHGAPWPLREGREPSAGSRAQGLGMLVLFLGSDGALDGWWRISGGAVAERGGAGDLPHVALAASGSRTRIVAIAPGDLVAIHWPEIPAGLAPAQEAAAARLILAEASAQPIGEMHVALGRAIEGGGRRCVALLPMLAMTDLLERLAALGFDPDMVVPEPLLLLPPEEGVASFARGDIGVYRGCEIAFAMEPDLAELVLADRVVTELSRESFEAQAVQALQRPALDLRQGPFARRRRLKLDLGQTRRLAKLGVAILAVTAAIQVAAIFRYTFAADALELEASRIAGRAVRGGTAGDLDRRLAELRGGGAGFSATAAILFEAVRSTPNVELSALSFGPDGSLRATVQADSPATVAALAQRVTAAGFAADAGPARSGGGRQIVDLTVRRR